MNVLNSNNDKLYQATILDEILFMLKMALLRGLISRKKHLVTGKNRRYRDSDTRKMKL